MIFPDEATALRAAIEAEISEPEPTTALPVVTACGSRIGLIERATAQRLLADKRFAADFTLTETAFILFPSSSESQLEENFARVARPLHDAGYFVQWRNELLDVCELAGGRCLARAERGLFRFFGMLTRSVYAVGVRRDGRVFISLRSRTKQVDPGLWDALAAGMISSGESPETALAREIAEEAGLTTGYTLQGAWSELQVRRRVPEGWMAEDAYILLAVVGDGVHPVNADGEVEEIRCVDREALFEMVKRRLTPVDTAFVFLETVLKD